MKHIDGIEKKKKKLRKRENLKIWSDFSSELSNFRPSSSFIANIFPLWSSSILPSSFSSLSPMLCFAHTHTHVCCSMYEEKKKHRNRTLASSLFSSPHVNILCWVSFVWAHTFIRAYFLLVFVPTHPSILFFSEYVRNKETWNFFFESLSLIVPEETSSRWHTRAKEITQKNKKRDFYGIIKTSFESKSYTREIFKRLGLTEFLLRTFSDPRA